MRRLMSAECSQIVHRDVKAPNVLLREVEGCYDVCISDFGTVFQPPNVGRSVRCSALVHLGLHCALGAVAGVAKAVNLADTVAQTGFKGTPASMSPEQLQVAPPRRFRTMHVALVGRGCGLRTANVVRRAAGEEHRMWHGTRVLHCAVPQESERITTKADCYGFAVLMWELATRLYPWLGLGLLHVRLSGIVDLGLLGGRRTATLR